MIGECGLTGISLDASSPQAEFWANACSLSAGLTDQSAADTIVSVGKARDDAREAWQNFICSTTLYFALEDRLHSMKSLRFNNEMETLLSNAEQLLKQSFAQFDVARNLDRTWRIAADDRTTRLQKALQVGAEHTCAGEWSNALMAEMRDEINDLHTGLRLSDWCYAQLTGGAETGRPLFSSSELSKDMTLNAEDPNHRDPLGRSLAERFELLSSS